MLLLLLGSYYAIIFQDQSPLRQVPVEVNVEQVAIRHILIDLEKQSGYRFFYSSEILDARKKITISYTGNLHDIIESIFDGDVTYTLNDRQIILQQRPPPRAADLASDTDAGVKQVTGVVLDETNSAIPGVNITVPGTTTGTVTDANGYYKIAIPARAQKLFFSFIGYKSAEEPIDNRQIIDASLIPDTREIEEVVIVGYGAVKKSDLTSSISTVTKRDLADRQVSELSYLVQGRAAGVDVSQGTIRIRGVNSFNPSDPLIVIDGFIGGNLSTLNPNDIENIEILKDAASTAIYGARGSNGVIVVTTKKGKKGPLAINFKYYEGLTLAPRPIKVLNADQYTDYMIELLEASGVRVPEKFSTGETRVDRTDWQKEIFRTARNREANIDFEGGGDKHSYFLSLGYKRTENPTFKGLIDDYLYINVRNSFDIRKWVRSGINIAVAYNNFHGGGERGNPGNLLDALSGPSYLTAYDSAGKPTAGDRNEDATEFGNPLTTAIHNKIVGATLNYQTSLWAEVSPFKSLSYRIQAGVNGVFGRDEFSNDEYTGGIAGPGTAPARLTKYYYYNIFPLVEQYLTYNKSIDKHQFSIMAGHSLQSGANNGRIGVRGVDYDPRISTVLTATSTIVTDDAIGKFAYLSYFSRATYQYANKYLLAFNFRADASPRFPPGNRWGKFPSVSFAWKIHEEKFMMNSPFDQLKLRAAWGVSGNDAIGDFRYLAKVYFNNVYYPFGAEGMPVKGATILNSVISDLRWESTETRTLGLDMTLAEGKINITADFYTKNTKDILYEVPRALSSGFGPATSRGGVLSNAATLRNRGFELEIGHQSYVGKFGYRATLMYSHNQNMVTSLGDGIYLDNINRTEVGYTLGYFYGWVADGVFMNQSELDAANNQAKEKGHDYYQLSATRPGDVRFKDLNGDGRVDLNDRTKIGNSHPTGLFGLNGTFTYQTFDLNFLFQGTSGASIYQDDSYNQFRGGSLAKNQSAYVLNRWRGEQNPGNGRVPRAIIGDPAQNLRASSLKISNGTYLKLKQISIGYALPSALSHRWGFTRVRLYASAYNLITWSKFLKYNYDTELSGDNMNRNVDAYNFPRPRMVMAGFQVSF